MPRREHFTRSQAVWTGVVALVAACVWLPGCTHHPSDAELKQAASSALGSDAQLKGQRLAVNVKDGEATIEGVVPNEATRQEARKAVESVPGVTKVNDRMEVPPPRVYTFAAGAEVSVEMLDGIDSKDHKAGQSFPAKLASPLTSGDTVVAPEGANAVVRLVEAEQAGRIKGRSELAVELTSLTCGDTTYEIASTTVARTTRSRGKQSARRIGIGAGFGAALGAIVGGGKGAAIGAGVVGGAATTFQLVTGGPAVRIPAGTRLDFQLEQPLTITLPPKL